ncbi:MAG: hypothetical protein FWE49_01550 [Synergistaceae bacterium]|nr:hypothetical protein [Synergistaceae bacterium]
MRKKINLFISFFVIFILMSTFHGEAFSQSLEIKQISEAYIGQPVTFEAVGEIAQSDDVNFEWAFSDNVTSIMIGKGGRSSSFTVLNTSPVALSLKALSENGEAISEAFLAIKVNEVKVDINLKPAKMLQIWNPKIHKEEEAKEFAVNQKFSFEVSLFPELKEKLNYKWKTSEKVSFELSENGKEITIWREEPGICSIEVEVTNRSGVLLGKGVAFEDVIIPISTIEQSQSRKKAWETWSEALKMWNSSGYMNVESYEKALELAFEALKINDDDYEIVDGTEKMKTDNDFIQRSKLYALEGDSFRENKKWTESLLSYRRSLAAWRFSEVENAISEVEETVKSIRLDREKASWVRDMAKAYEEEKRYEDAMRAYEESLLFDRQEEAVKGIERVDSLYKNLQMAAELNNEAENMILTGNYAGAMDKFKESLALINDEEIKQKYKNIDNLISGLKARALQLRREGNEHARRGRNAEALASYVESMRLWMEPAAEDLVKKFEEIVPADKRLPESVADIPVAERNAEAVRLLNAGSDFYRAGNYNEALNRYKRSYEIEEDQQLKDWIERIEGNMRAQASIDESNRLIRQGNALYSIRRYDEALKNYRASVELYPNKEVEDFIKHIEEILFNH